MEIRDSLGDRPGMASSYGQLGLLAERRSDEPAGLDWMIRCVALFLPQFPHPSTGPAPGHLARLTRELGMEALVESWRRVTGEAIPAEIRDAVAEAIHQMDEDDDGSPTTGAGDTT